MTMIYLYLIALFIVFIYLAYRLVLKRKRTKETYEDREDDVFYDAAKNIRRD
ncbi:MAG: hypothetical protein KAI02_01160 [Gammaproteobacteria bacterium]|nr:hypothetical protein [Gammaproteobacteria bacterium]